MSPFHIKMSYFYLKEIVANVDDILAEIFLEEREPTEEELKVNEWTCFHFMEYLSSGWFNPPLPFYLIFIQTKLHQNVGEWFAYLNAFLSW